MRLPRSLFRNKDTEEPGAAAPEPPATADAPETLALERSAAQPDVSEQTGDETEPSPVAAVAPLPALGARRRRRHIDHLADAEFGVETLGDVTPPRRGLVPTWLYWAGGGLLALAAVLLIVVAVWPQGARVRVPNLVGDTQASATKRVRSLGLDVTVRDTRMSDVVPAGGVVLQSPKAGTIVREGAVIVLDISAGSENFGMPDVIGQKLDPARRTLRELGLDVTFVTVASDYGQGTVISSSPAAGTTVTVGESIRLSVSAGVGATSTLLPTDLSAVTIVLDPAFGPAGATSDPSFDVARRVRALLEASGARVVLTRSVSDTPDTATTVDRIRRAGETTSTALVGFSVSSSGAVGLQIASLPSTGTPVAIFKAGRTLSTSLVTALRSDFPATVATVAVGDAVLNGYPGGAARVRLGSMASTADKLNFGDPTWADQVARAVFSALARTYGRD